MAAREDINRRRWCWGFCCDIVVTAFDAAAVATFERCEAKAAFDPMLFGVEEMGGDVRDKLDAMM